MQFLLMNNPNSFSNPLFVPLCQKGDCGGAFHPPPHPLPKVAPLRPATYPQLPLESSLASLLKPKTGFETANCTPANLRPINSKRKHLSGKDGGPVKDALRGVAPLRSVTQLSLPLDSSLAPLLKPKIGFLKVRRTQASQQLGE